MRNTDAPDRTAGRLRSARAEGTVGRPLNKIVL